MQNSGDRSSSYEWQRRPAGGTPLVRGRGKWSAIVGDRELVESARGRSPIRDGRTPFDVGTVVRCRTGACGAICPTSENPREKMRSSRRACQKAQKLTARQGIGGAIFWILFFRGWYMVKSDGVPQDDIGVGDVLDVLRQSGATWILVRRVTRRESFVPGVGDDPKRMFNEARPARILIAQGIATACSIP